MFSHNGSNTPGLESVTELNIQGDSPGGAAKLLTRRRSLLSSTVLLLTATLRVCIVEGRLKEAGVYSRGRGRTAGT